jgi:hypothetical protein
MNQPSLSTTTHTIEMSQIAELNSRLTSRGAKITAAELGLAGVGLFGAAPNDSLPGSATLVRLSWQGPPNYPYIHGHFSAGDTNSHLVDLHTRALRELCRRLGLHQSWGSGSVARPAA